MRPTRAYLRCVVLVATVVLAALVAGQPALVAVAVPFVFALLRPASEPPSPAVDVQTRTFRTEQGREVPLTVRIDTSPEGGLIRATLTAAGTGRRTAWLASDGTPHTVTVRARRMGTHELGAVAVLTYDELLLRVAALPPTSTAAVRVLPPLAPVQVSEALPATVAFAGEHVARTAGPGVEFAGVRPFAAGDRPRQVHWRTTARSGTPQVIATRREHSARICLLIDSTCSGELGQRLLELTARAALGVARSYLDLGDAVALVEFGARDRQLRYAAGRAQLPRVADWLADLRPRLSTVAAPAPPKTPFGSPSDLVIAVSPLIEPTTATGLVRLRQRGIPVAVLAALPAGGLDFGRRGDLVEQVAARLWRLQREQLIHQLARLGVPVVPWQDAGPGAATQGLDLALRRLARQARAPRLALR